MKNIKYIPPALNIELFRVITIISLTESYDVVTFFKNNNLDIKELGKLFANSKGLFLRDYAVLNLIKFLKELRARVAQEHRSRLRIVIYALHLVRGVSGFVNHKGLTERTPLYNIPRSDCDKLVISLLRDKNYVLDYPNNDTPLDKVVKSITLMKSEYGLIFDGEFRQKVLDFCDNGSLSRSELTTLFEGLKPIEVHELF